MESIRQDLSTVSTATVASASSPTPPSIPTNDDIEAIIQLATSSGPATDSRQLGKDTRTQLYVGNLPYRVRWQDLKDLFRKAGTVLRADVSLGPDNRSRGFGTVLLATAEDAGRAIDMFNGFIWQTRTLEVRPDRIPAELVNPTLPSSGAGYVPATTAASSGIYGSNLITALGPSPLPTSTNAYRDFDYSLARGLERPRSTAGVSRSLFVGNLPFHCQWQDLKDLFRQAGAVVRADVTLGADGRSRGFGTVVFATEGDADHAVKMFNGYEYSGRPLKVHYDKFSTQGSSGSPPSSSSLGEATAWYHPDPAGALAFPSGHSIVNHPSISSMHIQLPMNYAVGFGTASGPASPYELYPPFYNPVPPPVHELQSQFQQSDESSISSTSAESSTNSDCSPTRSPASTYSSSNRSNSHHPGHIALPPPPLVTSFPPLTHPHSPHLMSPSHPHYLVSSQHSHHATPHGLPPITPSMPPFNFLPPFTPPAYNPNHPLGTPSSPSGMHHHHHHSHILSPFSPGVTMSPGAFWGRPGGANPFINPAVGGPVHVDADAPAATAAIGHDASETTSVSQEYSESRSVTSLTEAGREMGYFPPTYVPNKDTGYFPPMPPIIAAPVPKAGALSERQVDSGKDEGPKDEELTSPSETDTGENSSSSGATSWHTSDDMHISGQLEKMKMDESAESRDVQDQRNEFTHGIDESRRAADDSRAPPRTLSLSPSARKPALTHRPDSDP